MARILWVEPEGFDPVPGGGFSSYGSAGEHAVVYLADDVMAGGATSRFLHGTPSAGYHIVSVDRPQSESCMLTAVLDERLFPRYSGTCPRNALSIAPDDLNTTVVVTPGWDELVYEDIETAW